VALSVFTTADFARLGFPSFQILSPYQQTTGWVAASVRMIYTGVHSVDKAIRTGSDGSRVVSQWRVQVRQSTSTTYHAIGPLTI
jgi:hypothetical protein